MVFIIDHIHHLMNESKMQNFAYNSERRVYVFSLVSYSLTFFYERKIKNTKINEFS
jgi:hypothetical protein